MPKPRGMSVIVNVWEIGQGYGNEVRSHGQAGQATGRRGDASTANGWALGKRKRRWERGKSGGGASGKLGKREARQTEASGRRVRNIGGV